MAKRARYSRRRFFQLCASTAALVSVQPRLLAAAEGDGARDYPRVRLVDPDGRPLRAASLEVGRNYVFHYPYVGTPCFLLDVGTPVPGGERLQTKDGQTYRSQPGTGPRRSLVAFSAICSHRMTYPARQVSFINYRQNKTDFVGKDEQVHARAEIIYCCSEKSVYDATAGARVLGGPAPQPLATVVLEYDPDSDGLYAAGTRGGALFDRFFETFGFQLSLQYGDIDIRELMSGASPVLSLEEYSRNIIRC